MNRNSKYKVRLDQTAKQILLEGNPEMLVWYGNFGLCQKIYHRYKGAEACKNIHPLTQINTVLRTLSKSPLFEHLGHIRHLGTLHPVFKLKV